MLLQTNSYVVPKEKREEHERLIRRIRQALVRMGCDHFEVFEQVGNNWGPLKGGQRFIQIMRFRDRQHHLQIQEAEKSDPGVQQLINEFCELIDLPSQQGQGLFAMGYYSRMAATPGNGVHDSGAAQQEPAYQAGITQEPQELTEEQGEDQGEPPQDERAAG